MSSVRVINRSLLYFLCLTMIGSAIAFFLILRAYDTVFAIGYYSY